MLKVSIDEEKCIGCMLCPDICPETFEMNEEGTKSIVKKSNVDEGGSEKEAEDACPTKAIIIK